MKLWVYILILLLAVACEREVPSDTLEFTKKLVVNAKIRADSTFKIQLSSNVATLTSTQNTYLTGTAYILLKKNNQLIFNQDVDFEKGSLELPYLCQAGDVFEMQLTYADYPTIYARDSVPSYQPEMRIDTLKKGPTDYSVYMTLTDGPKDEKYMLRLHSRGKEWNGADSVQVVKDLMFSSNDKLFFSNIRTAAQQNSFALLDDAILFNQQTQFSLNFDIDSLFQDRYSPEELLVEISTVSVSMYDFYVNVLENTYVYGSPLSNVSADYGNVQNGFGIFGFQNAVTITYEIKE